MPVVLFAMVLLTVLHLPYPFAEDQALFMGAAREFNDGARLYGEFWDLKQPGIYWWYFLAGRLFGFDEMGMRWLDAIWTLCTAAILWAGLRSRGTWVSVLGPCLGIGSFYAHAGAWHLSQVEWLVSAPMVVILWSTSHEERSITRRAEILRYGVAGAMLGVVGLFKLMVVPVAGALLLVAFGHALMVDKRSWTEVFIYRAVPLLVGSALAILPAVAWLAFDGTLRMAIWTTFVAPGLFVREYQRHSIHALLDSLGWFVAGTWALIPWAAWAAYQGIRRRSRLELMLIAWIIFGFATTAVQVLSYWQYHFDLFFAPLGILAALGFVDAMRRLAANGRLGLRRAALASMVLCAGISMGWPLARKVQMVVDTGAFAANNRRAFDIALDPGSKSLFDSADAARPLSRESDRIVVWGDPGMYAKIGRRPIVEVDGGTYYLAAQLDQVAEIIRQKRPVLVYMSKFRDTITYHGSGAVPRVVQANYLPFYENAAGVWYRLR